jgi:glycosyltransferase involved in cell wall biosynthesis
MSSSAENETQADLLPASQIGIHPHQPPVFPGAIFLMTNSLETGGSERQFVELACALKRSGCDVRVACIQKKGSFLDRGTLDGIGELPTFSLGGSLYGLQSIRSRWRLMRLLRNSGITIAHAFDFYTNLTLIPAAKLAGVPAVIGSHRQLGDLLTSAQFRAQLAVFHWCDRVVCNSQAAADRLSDAGLQDQKLVVIGNGLPHQAFAKTAAALEPKAGILRVGMIGRMNAVYKNQSGFLRAAARVASEFPNVDFILVGDGPLRSTLEQQANQIGLTNRVTFLGDRSDIPAVLASLDISVVPSISESLSNVMLESMAAGIPVVATAVGGNKELGGNGRALLVPSNDDEKLAAGIGSLLRDVELGQSISYKARQFAEENFAVERIGEQYQQLYSEVLATKSNKHRAGQSFSPRQNGSPIRVAVVAPSLRYVGGQSVQADLLVRTWKSNREIDARFIPVDPRLPYGLRWAERIPFLRTIIREPLYLFSLWRGLLEVDVAHIFSASYSSFLLAPLPAWATARFLGKPTLINYHSGECRDHLQKSALARLVLRETDRIVVPSEYLVDVLREFGLKAQIVSNVVDLSQFRYRLRRPLRPHLICTRGFHLYYGVDVVVKAFAEVQKVFPDANLDLVGGGPLEGEIRELVRQLNLQGVHFLGVSPHKEIAQFYDRADIFVNASNLDNMPVSVLEAFASGTPVATTAPEGVRYIVEHERTGLLSDPGDPTALAQNLIRLLKDPDLATRLAENALAECERWTWASVRDRWSSIYVELVPSRRRQAGLLQN